MKDVRLSKSEIDTIIDALNEFRNKVYWEIQNGETLGDIHIQTNRLNN